MTDVLNELRLGYLFEAVRLGSIRAAADVLGVNPSVVSRQIAQLEKDTGVTLIERLSRGVRATQAGSLLTQRHRQWMADRDDTLAKLREIQGLKRGHIDIFLGEGFVSDLMSGPLLQFWQRHPQLTMSFELAGTNDVVAAVAEDRCHIGWCTIPRPTRACAWWLPRDNPFVSSRGPITRWRRRRECRASPILRPIRWA